RFLARAYKQAPLERTDHSPKLWSVAAFSLTRRTATAALILSNALHLAHFTPSRWPTTTARPDKLYLSIDNPPNSNFQTVYRHRRAARQPHSRTGTFFPPRPGISHSATSSHSFRLVPLGAKVRKLLTPAI